MPPLPAHESGDKGADTVHLDPVVTHLARRGSPACDQVRAGFHR